ncbi:indigoidine synthase A-like protein [Mycena amicta]|nr:indigoidine synthase A-like protein [Mycena amicta]
MLRRVLGTRHLSGLSAAVARGAPVDIHPEVEDALATGKPVVALETALTTHGLPHPQNLRVTLDLEDVVRSTACVPATIGVVSGRVKIGLQRPDLERLADVQRTPRSVKISRRDIAPTLALKADGGTTICATLIFAALAGIKVYAASLLHYAFSLTLVDRLGGVHRGGENSLDISADLHELTRCPVGLVSAGIKSILDIGRTLEYLETLGVPVVSFSKTKDFPAFFSPRSGFQSQLGMQNGALFAVPIPEEYAERGRLIQEAVDQAVRESENNGMNKRGKDVAELTKHDSIEANIALLKNSALIGGQIAFQYQIASQSNPTKPSSFVPTFEDVPAKVMVVGSSAIDISAQAATTNSNGSTTPGRVMFGLGGVARNMAEACHRLGESPLLVSPVGGDTWGTLLYDQTAAMGMRIDGFIRQDNERTAVCNLLLDATGNLLGGVADMDITQKLNASVVVAQVQAHRPSLVALDGNLSVETIQTIVESCVQDGIPVLSTSRMKLTCSFASEPTSIAKSIRILPNSLKRSPNGPACFFTPNIAELRHVYQRATEEGGIASSDAWWSAVDRLSLSTTFRNELDRLAKKFIHDDKLSDNLDFLVKGGVAQMAIQLTPLFRHIFVKCGEQGVFAVLMLAGEEAKGWMDVRSDPERKRYIVAHGDSGSTLILQHFPPHPTQVVSSTGAGDSLVGALLAGLVQDKSPLRDPQSLARLMSKCQRAAHLTLQSHTAVSPMLSTLAMAD